MLKKRWREILTVAVCVIAVVLTAVLYSVFASNHIFNESSSHLTELYEQVNSSFSKMVDSNRDLMYSWRRYVYNSVDIIKDESDAEKSAEKRKELAVFMYTGKVIEFNKCNISLLSAKYLKTDKFLFFSK